jgi:hypothetical protein
VLAVMTGGLSSFSWSGTFIGILLTATVVGAALGWADYARRTGGHCKTLRQVREV